MRSDLQHAFTNQRPWAVPRLLRLLVIGGAWHGITRIFWVRETLVISFRMEALSERTSVGTQS